MVVGTPSFGPVKQSLGFLNRQIVDARIPAMHQPIRAELPVFISIRTEPLPRRIVGFIREADRNPRVAECPQFLDQTIVQLASPFARKKRDNLLTPMDEFRPVPPPAVDRIGKTHTLRVARIPCILSRANLGHSCLARKGWHNGIGYNGRHETLLLIEKIWDAGVSGNPAETRLFSWMIVQGRTSQREWSYA